MGEFKWNWFLGACLQEWNLHSDLGRGQRCWTVLWSNFAIDPFPRQPEDTGFLTAPSQAVINSPGNPRTYQGPARNLSPGILERRSDMLWSQLFTWTPETLELSNPITDLGAGLRSQLGSLEAWFEALNPVMLKPGSRSLCRCHLISWHSRPACLFSFWIWLAARDRTIASRLMSFLIILSKMQSSESGVAVFWDLQFFPWDLQTFRFWLFVSSLHAVALTTWCQDKLPFSGLYHVLLSMKVRVVLYDTWQAVVSILISMLIHAVGVS